jgi:DNA-directed RNA polymerase specialized sigma24 family protein
MVVQELHQIKKEKDFKTFYQKIETMVPEIRNFVSKSLKAAENEGKLDRGYFNADGVLDEVYLDIFSQLDPSWDDARLRYLLFKNAVANLHEKKAIEANQPESVNTNDLLKEELDRLDEAFTTDGDGDLILNTELDDISYKQDRKYATPIFMDETVVSPVIKKLKLPESLVLSTAQKASFGHVYSSIPHLSKTIFELYVFGDRNTAEIAEILSIEEEKARKVLTIVSERFKRI